jgi:hypothetical protein
MDMLVLLKNGVLSIQATLNPRKSNGDLGDLECDICKEKSGVYITLMFSTFPTRICGHCLQSWIDKINEKILNSCEKSVDKL